MVNGFVRQPFQELKVKRSLGARLASNLGYALAIALVLTVLFMLTALCYTVWGIVFG